MQRTGENGHYSLADHLARPPLITTLGRRSNMRVAVLLLLNLLAQHASANDLLWQKLKTEADLVVLMRNTRPAGGNSLTWDESGSCKGESMLTVEGEAHARKIGEAFAKHGIKPYVITSPMCRCRDTARIAFGEAHVTDAALREIASADRERTSAFERKAQSLIASHRGSSPVAFVSHRPNIDLLSLESIGEGELLVARASENGELTVLGRIQVQP